MEEHRLIKNIVFRLVRRHIAGSTMNSALDALKNLNDKGMNTTLTFLNEDVRDPIKARYNANTYVQMAKQISRLHLNTALSIRLSQIGFALDTGSADKLLDEILEAAGPDASTVWLEGGTGVTNDQLMDVYKNRIEGRKNIGVEVPLSYYQGLDGIAGMIPEDALVRITSHPYVPEQNSKNGKDYKGIVKNYMNAINTLLKRSSQVCIHEPDESLMVRIAASSNGHKNDIVFGVPFGYNNRKIRKLQKMKVKLDVYVPYGKDWVPYAIYGLASGRLRGIAVALLDGKKEVGKEDVIEEE